MQKYSIFSLFLSLLFFSLKLAGADFYGPAPFVDILNRSFSKNWTPQAISTIENRAHVLILDAATQQYCLSVTSGTMDGLEVVTVSSLTDSSATYGKVLRSMFQMQDVTIETLSADSLTGEYTFRPELMIYYGIDSNSSDGSSTASSLQVSRIKAVDLTEFTETGYLAFSFTGTSSSAVAQASKRYILNSTTGALEQDTSWSSNQWLKFGASGIELVTSESDATSVMLASSLDLIDVANNPGEDMNPTSNDWQTNAFAAWPTKDGVVEVTSIANSSLNSLRDGTEGDNIDSSYREQFGTSADATAVASAYLDQIEAALTNAGESLRYPKELYLAARANLLSHTFGAIDEVNAELGESTVPFVYFTNAQDDSGVYHPFMVVGTRNGTGGPNFLIDVARPPGDGSGTYEESTITRNAFLTNGLYRVPMKDYGLITTLLDNDMSSYNNLALAAGIDTSLYDVYNYASYSVSGITLDGVKIYPSYNNTLYFTPMNGEITSTGVHVGQGMTLHFHSDGHSFNGNGINLYNIEDYVGKQHPPLIGFGLDGIAIYGKYETSYSSMDGYSVALDEYGGHDHDDYGYHYHAHAEDVSSTDKTGAVFNFTQHFMMVGAYKGNINSIPDFQNGGTNQLKDSELAKYVGLEGTYVTTSFDTSTTTTYTVSVDTPTGGTVTGAGTYDSGTSVSLTATPDSGYTFSSWGGDASGSTSPLTLTVDQDLTVTATFSAIPTTYTLSIDTPTGGTVTGAGTYDSGTSVSLTATPDSGYTFSSWGGDASGSTSPLTLTVDQDLTVTATFSVIPTTATYTVSVVDPTGGSISGAGTYDSGSSVTLIATADSGYSFSSWGGDASGSTSPLTMSVSQDLNVTATFASNTLWTSSSSVGSGWYELNDTFGFYYLSDQTWIYHFGMGWLYPASETTDSVWLYKVGRGWMYMKTSDFPHMWDDSTSNWVYYAENNGQPSLYEYANTAWVTLD